jgi:predicted membrane protein
MKEVLKKVLNRTVLEPIIIFIVSMATLQFLVYPGLTINNTFLNILSGALGIFLVLVVLVYIDDKIKDKFEKKEIELSEEPIKPKKVKKSNLKQFDGVKSDEPFVKTRKKTNKTK